MTDKEKIDELNRKLQTTEMHQQQLAWEIKQLKEQVKQFTEQQPYTEKSTESILNAAEIFEEQVTVKPVAIAISEPARTKPKNQVAKEKTAIEDFIGTNLMNKIGIAVLVIGIGFGVKYAIDHQMLNPLTRIILGYLVSTGLVFLALRLKKEYHGFSAVLLSGGMASLYFITYAAYDYYALIPQIPAFAIMVLFTGFTVFAALQYNLQVISVIGLVGSYAVPFLLSDNSGRVLILFSYITLINVGILIISFIKEWRVLLSSSFSLTWLIFGVWMLSDYDSDMHFWISISFATIFFVTFYIAFLAVKFIKDIQLKGRDIVLVLMNCFIFYGSGYGIINDHPLGENYLGLFTLFNSLLHFIVCVLLFTRLRQARDSFYLIAGLVLTFLTLAVPVQLDGNWVTVIWSVEACVLFWIGRVKKFSPYELISYAVMALAALSLANDWESLSYIDTFYFDEQHVLPVPFWNITFLTSLMATGMFGFITYYSEKVMAHAPTSLLASLLSITKYLIPASLLIVLYLTFFLEINLFFQTNWIDTAIKSSTDHSIIRYNFDWKSFKVVWLINYSLFFTACAWGINQRYRKSLLLSKLLLVINSLVMLVFLISSLDEFESLRYSYLNTDEYFVHNFWNIGIRYISYAFIALSLFINFTIISEQWATQYKEAERLLFNFTLLVLLSSELLSILDLNGIENGFKLALSILWGGYALFLIVRGFSKDQPNLRISGIVLFAVTLLKLFFYDISGMSTLSKTVVLMIMGILLLISSFIYNKRKKQRDDEK